MEMNYSQFYALLKRMPYDGDREDLKEQLVLAASCGRTTSLRQLTHDEYTAMIRDMEQRGMNREELRRKRSACLKLMQQLGVDTTKWSRVNALCLDNRIAGKPFARLSIAELGSLQTKLRAISRRGGLNSSGGHESKPGTISGTGIIMAAPVAKA